MRFIGAVILGAIFAAIAILVLLGIAAAHRRHAPSSSPHPRLGLRDVRLLIITHLDARRRACAAPGIEVNIACVGTRCPAGDPTPYPELVVLCLRQIDVLPCAAAAQWDGFSLAPPAPRLCVGAAGVGVRFDARELEDALQGDSL